MTEKEKAKAYDKALEKAKYLHEAAANGRYDIEVKTFECIFPELKESGDEKVRKALLEMVHDTIGDDLLIDYDIHKGDALAWLEKQREQEPTIEMKSAEESLGIDSATYNKIVDEVIYGEQKDFAPKPELKFKIGDWVVLSISDGEKVVQIDSVEYFKSGEPKYITSEGRWFGNGTTAHLWSIQDAKDGDVLITVFHKRPFIYKGCLDPNHPSSPVAYCGIDSEGYFCIGGDKFDHWWTAEEIRPATKEQFDHLFKKMREAGYEWNKEKKELIQIEKQGEQKSKWSDEDECYMGECISAIATKDSWSFEEKRRAKHWLKSLKQRMEERQ